VATIITVPTTTAAVRSPFISGAAP